MTFLPQLVLKAARAAATARSISFADAYRDAAVSGDAAEIGDSGVDLTSFDFTEHFLRCWIDSPATTTIGRIVIKLI